MLDLRAMAQRSFGGLLAVLMLLMLVGCPSVMTTNQVEQVNKFAKTAEAYGPLPGDVLRTYADQKWALDLVDMSTLEPDDAAELFKLSSESRQEMYQEAAQVDQSLAVLNTYASLLKTLTASDYTEATGKEAQRFGEAIDTGVVKYNELSGSSVSSFGSIAASAVQAIGGMYIRHKQGKALKAAVTNAEKSVNQLLKESMELMEPYGADDKHFVALRSSLQTSLIPLTDSWNSAGEPVPLDVVEWFREQYLSSYQGSKLAKLSYDAAKKYQAAHEKLVEAVEVKENLVEIIGSVEAFASDVEAALALKKQMEK